MCLVNLKVLRLISSRCCFLHSQFHWRPLQRYFWVIQTDLAKWWPECFSFLLISNFNLSFLSHVWGQREGWWEQLCWNCYEENFYRTFSPVSWKRTRNYLQGVFVQTRNCWTLGQTSPTANCGILGGRSNLNICLVWMAWFSQVLRKPGRCWTCGLSPPCSWGQEGKRKWPPGGETASPSST